MTDDATTRYTLPDGRVVGIYASVAQGAERVGFQLADGSFVVAVKTPPSLAAFVAACASDCAES